VRVDYATSGGSALPGLDYTPVAGTLTFKPGVSLQTFAVPLADDATVKPSQTVGLVLSNPQDGTALGAIPNATLTLVSDDPRLRFAGAASRVAGAPKATIAVRRLGPLAPAVSVEYATSDGTAQAPGDYTPAAGTLSFGPGVTAQTFAVPIVNDAIHEDPE